MPLERIVKMYFSKKLWTLSGPDKGAARRVVAQAMDDPNTAAIKLTTLKKIQDLLAD